MSSVEKLALDADANALFLLQIESKISARRLSDLHSHFGQVINRIGLISFSLVQSPYQLSFRFVIPSVCQGASKRAGQSVIESVSQSIRPSVSQSDRLSVSQSVIYPVTLSINQSVSQLVRPSVSQSVHPSVS